MNLEFCRLGLTEYRAAHALQTQLVAERRTGERGDIVLVTEHPGVFTLGRRGGREHLVASEQFLADRGIPVIHVERGGEVTYHGRGQLVVYPIIDLRKTRLPLTDYIYLLEELMLRLASDCGVTAVRDTRNHGVWVGSRKLGSVGIAVRHGITFHGLAVNVNPDLQPFSWINPCGLREVKMTSLAIEAGVDISLDRLILHLPEHLSEIFGQTVSETDPDTLLCMEEL